MRPSVTYTLYATSSKEQTSDVITSAQFEEGSLLSETRNDTESGDKSDSESIMMSKKYMKLKYHSISVDQGRYATSIVAKYLDTATVKVIKKVL